MAQINTGDLIDNATVVNRFNELMRDRINPQIQVSRATPFGTGTYRQLTNVPAGGIPYAHVGPSSVTGASVSGGGLTGIIDGAALATYLRNLTRDYSQIRRFNWRLRFNRTGYPSNNGNIVQEQQSNKLIHLNANSYKQTITNNDATYGLEEGDIIDASNFEGFINNLYSQWNSLKENSIGNIYVDTCHASCHSNCHSSRGRR